MSNFAAPLNEMERQCTGRFANYTNWQKKRQRTFPHDTESFDRLQTRSSDYFVPPQALLPLFVTAMYSYDELSCVCRGVFYQGYWCSKCGLGAHKECLGRFGCCGKTGKFIARPQIESAKLLHHATHSCTSPSEMFLRGDSKSNCTNSTAPLWPH